MIYNKVLHSIYLDRFWPYHLALHLAFAPTIFLLSHLVEAVIRRDVRRVHVHVMNERVRGHPGVRGHLALLDIRLQPRDCGDELPGVSWYQNLTTGPCAEPGPTLWCCGSHRVWAR